MEFVLVVEQRSTADGKKYNSAKIVAVVPTGDGTAKEILVTYDRDVICNLLDYSPARLRDCSVGRYKL